MRKGTKMKKVNTYYWLVSIACTILLFKPVSVAYAQDSSTMANEANEENELVQNDNLYISDIYENTLLYNGKLVPGLTLSLIIKNQEETNVAIPLSSNGKFVINFTQHKIKVGDSLIFHISGNEETMYEEQIEKKVLDKKDGSEIILSEEDTPQEKEFKEATTLSEIYTHTKEVNGKTMAGTMICLVSEGKMTKSIYSDDTTGGFNFVFGENQTERHEGEDFQFVFVNDGMMTVVKKTVLKPTKEWEMKVDEIRKATKLPTIYQEMKSYDGETVPNAKIKVSFLGQVLVEVVSDKEGNFTFDSQLLSDIPLGESLFLTVTDSEGVYFSIETIIYPKQELIEEAEQKPELDAEKEENLNEEQSSPENNLPKPSIKEKNDNLVSLLPTQSEVPSSQSSTEDLTTVIKEPEVLETTTVLSNSVETQKEKPDEINKTKKIEGSDFAVLATIVLIGTVTMSGLLYKY